MEYLETDGDLTSTSTNNDSDVDQHKKKKQRKNTNKKEVLTFKSNVSTNDVIRSLFQRDLRKSYLRLIVDAFNTSNIKHFRNVTKRICTETCAYIESFTGGVNLYGPNYREFSGLEALCQYIEVQLNSLPDLVFEVIDSKLRKIPTSIVPRDHFIGSAAEVYDGTFGAEEAMPSCVKYSSLIVGKYNYSGTKLYDIVVKNNNETSSIPACNDVTITSHPIDNISKPAVRPNIRFQGILIFLLDDNAKIERMEFHYSDIIT